MAKLLRLLLRQFQLDTPVLGFRLCGCCRVDWLKLAETGSHIIGSFAEPMSFSLRAWNVLKDRLDDFDLIHDNQTLGYGILALQQAGMPVLETIHHPITVDRKLEIEHARSLPEEWGKRRWYAFTKMQTRVAKRIIDEVCSFRADRRQR